jgi:hypothetical protein
MDIQNPMGISMDMNFYPRGNSHKQILSTTVDMVAVGYLQYPIQIRFVAISRLKFRSLIGWLKKSNTP